jgi:hypothetical protein
MVEVKLRFEMKYGAKAIVRAADLLLEKCLTRDQPTGQPSDGP